MVQKTTPVEDENESMEEITIEITDGEEDSSTDRSDNEMEEETLVIEMFDSEQDSTSIIDHTYETDNGHYEIDYETD